MIYALSAGKKGTSVKRLLVAFLLLFSLLGNIQAADLTMSGSGSLAARMMNAMWDMMEWFFTQRRPEYRNIPWNYVYPGSPWNYSYPTSPWQRTATGPWSGPLNIPWDQGYGYPDYGPSGFSYPSIWGTLDGVWRASTGEYWIVQGNRFVLYGGGDRYLSGNISIQGDHIIAYIPVTGMTFDYRYWLVDGMLLVRDEFGNAMVLDLVQPTAGNWQW